MASRMRKPETDTLHISNGDWLLVKKHLTAGEQREIIKRTVKPMHAGDVNPEFDPVEADLAYVLTYLLDWSLTDLDGQRMVIARQSPAVVTAALDNLPFDDYAEITSAIQAHDARMSLARAAEKNGQDGASKSSAISPSQSILAGATATS